MENQEGTRQGYMQHWHKTQDEIKQNKNKNNAET